MDTNGIMWVNGKTCGRTYDVEIYSGDSSGDEARKKAKESNNCLSEAYDRSLVYPINFSWSVGVDGVMHTDSIFSTADLIPKNIS